MVKKNLSKKSEEKGLKEITLPVIQVASGILQSDKKVVIKSIGDSLQEFVKGNQWYRLKKEIQKYREKGKSNEEYFNNPEKTVRLLDFLKLFDDKIPDEDIFRAMKSIFFTTISKDTSEQDEVLGYELLKICKKLDSGDILVLKTCYKLKDVKDDSLVDDKLERNRFDYWLTIISVALDLPEEIIEIHEQKLVEQNLLSERGSFGGDDVVLSKITTIDPENARLTGLGLKLYEFIANYQE